MNTELKLNVLMGTVSRYSVVTLVFFTTYIVFQPPSTIIIRYLGPRVHLSTIVTLWGAVMIGMGFAKDWQSLAALRVVLGILEAGFFPSCVYLMSTWYTRYDIGKRYSVFYILGSLASACAGILAYGLMQLNGKEGLTGWRWYVFTYVIFSSQGTDKFQDLHHRGCSDLLPWYRRILDVGRFPRQGAHILEVLDRARSQVHHQPCRQGSR